MLSETAPTLMRRRTLAALVAYHVALAVLAVYILVSIWPLSVAESRLQSSNGFAALFGFTFALPDEVRLLWLVILTGGLGSFIHSATSLVTYAGSRKLFGSWGLWYLLRPPIGATLALVVYFVVRGGFLTATVAMADINVFGVAALSGLVGMFSKEATDKMAEAFRTLFKGGEDAKRADKLAAETTSPGGA